jgi:phage N-6-adenine-methyltransferase
MAKGLRAMSKRTMREDWCTPPALFAKYDAEFHFTVDGAATAANALCKKFCDGRLYEPDWANETVWLNPPYGYKNLARWMERSYTQSQRGATVVCLVPAHTGQPWWHDWVIGKASEIRWIKGKVKFVGADSCAPFPSCIVIYRPQPDARRTREGETYYGGCKAAEWVNSFFALKLDGDSLMTLQDALDVFYTHAPVMHDSSVSSPARTPKEG